MSKGLNESNVAYQMQNHPVFHGAKASVESFGVQMQSQEARVQRHPVFHGRQARPYHPQNNIMQGP